MITFNANQTAIASSTVKKEASWLLQVDKNGNGAVDYYWSTKTKTWDGHDYVFKVIEFSDIQMNRAQSESGIQAPSEFEFTISNAGNTLTTGDFSNARVKLLLVVGAGALEEEMRAWSFRVVEVNPGYQQITFQCVDWLQAYLEGDYPNTPRIYDLFPRANMVSTNACVPLIIGKPCIPLESIPLERITNGDMEIDGNWANYNACDTCEQSADKVHSGTKSWKIITSAAPGDGEGIQGDVFTTVTGKCYTVSFWVYSPDHATEPHVVVRARKGDDSGWNEWPGRPAPLGFASVTGFTRLGWSKYTITWKEAAGGAGAYIVLSNIGDTYTAYYDDVSVEERYYLLGPSAPVYTIDTVRSPSDVDGGSNSWKSTERTFTQSVMTGRDANTYDVAEFLIADGDSDGTGDSNLIYEKSGKYLGLPTYYSRDDTSGLTAPGDALEYILEDMGIPSALIDAATQATANTAYAGWGLEWNLGLWFQEDRKKLLARLLQMCHTELIVRDKIYFKVHSKTSQKTLTKADIIKTKERGEGTFSYEYLVQESQKDSGYVAFQEAGKCLDNLPKFLIGAKGTTDYISDEVVRCDYVQDSQDAQCLGILALQRLLLAMAKVRFNTKGTCLALEPDDVITLNEADYGGNYDVLADSVTFNKDLSMNFETTRHSAALDDWGDLAPGAIVIVTDGTSYTYYTVTVGPDMTDGGGGQIGNVLPGRLRVGQTGNYILLDPFRPIMQFVEGGQSRLEVGDLGDSDYGVEIIDSAGVTIMKLDGSGVNTLSGWIAGQYTLMCQTGAVGMNAEETGGVDWRFWAGDAVPGDAEFRVDEDGNLYATSATITGSITATTGAIGGWVVMAGYLYSLAGGTPVAAPEDGVVLASGNPALIVYENTEKRLEVGYLAAGVYGIKGYDNDGIAVMFELSDTQKIIAGWTISQTTLANGTDIILDASNKAISINDATYGNAGIQFQFNAGTPRFYVGDGANEYIQFDGTNLSWKGANSELTAAGNIILAGGTIGGWTIGATTLTSANITLDDGNDLILVGTLTIDGANDRIRSGNYVSGMAGAGFTLEPDLLEVGNIAARGIIRTAVFQKDIVSALGGSFIFSMGADVLATDMTAADASTLTIEGNETFAVGDFLWVKDDTDAEWLEVTNAGSAPTYTVTRDKDADYGADSNPAWKKGATVINTGQSGDGFVYMTASETNAPYLSVITHAGAPWTTLTTHCRIGNLNGSYGYVADAYGFAFGDTTLAGSYITYDATSGGLAIKGTIAIESMYALPSDEHLVGYWSFDDGSGTVVVDGSGNGNDGTLVNAPDWVDGVVGTGLEFDGVDQYVNCGNDASLDITSSLTIACWFYTSGSANYEDIVAKRQGDVTVPYGIIKTDTDKIMFEYCGIGGGWKGVTGDDIPLDQWIQLVAVISGTSYNLYINGIDAGNGTLDNALQSYSAVNLNIGRFDNGEYVDGLIDEVRIYKTALTASEVKALYLYPAGNKGSQISGAQTPWSAAGDRTKIDGGNIFANSITLVDAASDFDLADIAGDLDDIANGATYGRVQIGALDGGYVDLLRMSADSTERLLVTAGGIEGYANNVKNFELASGIAYLGDQANEHIKLSATGLEVKDGATVLATYGATVVIGEVGANLSNIEITAGALNLRTNEVDIISISNAGVASITIADGGEISLEAGGDIVMTPSDANPSLIKWSTTYNLGVGATAAFGVCFWPTVDGVGSFRVGYDPTSPGNSYFDAVSIRSATNSLFGANFDVNNLGVVSCAAGNASGYVSIGVKASGNYVGYYFYYNQFYPSVDNQVDFGKSDARWKNGWFDGYIALGITDTDGTVEGQIWYDASEDKLKFKTAAGVETITSA